MTVEAPDITPPKPTAIDPLASPRSLEFESAEAENVLHLMLLGYERQKEKHDKDSESPKHSHTSEHLKAVQDRATRIAEALGVLKDAFQINALTIAIAWHDTVIEFKKPPDSTLIAMINRNRGARAGDFPDGENGNEAKSWLEVKEAMVDMNLGSREPIFSEEFMELVHYAIDVTYPHVDAGITPKGSKYPTGAVFKEYEYYDPAIKQNPALGRVIEELEKATIVRDGIMTEGEVETVVKVEIPDPITKGMHFSQPHLEKALERGEIIPPAVLITALADLGSAGMDPSSIFFKEGDNEMLELFCNLHTPEARKLLLVADTDEARASRALVAKTMLGWLKGQISFVTWQALRFEKIVYLLKQSGQLDDDHELNLRAQFSHYKDNIRMSLGRYQAAQSLYENSALLDEKRAFTQLAGNMRYSLPKPDETTE